MNVLEAAEKLAQFLREMEEAGFSVLPEGEDSDNLLVVDVHATGNEHAIVVLEDENGIHVKGAYPG